MHNQEIRKARILGDFAEAVDQKQFKVLYQPKYSIQGKFPVLSSLEALVSWNHPKFGMMKPDSFIPQFEKNGLIQKLDRYVWAEVVAQMKKWIAEFGSTVPVSVNMSRVDLHDPKLADFLLELTSKNGISPEQFHIEITESAYIKESSVIAQTVAKLRKAGFLIEMDDFGSGYSSLNMLAQLPIDALKLEITLPRAGRHNRGTTIQDSRYSRRCRNKRTVRALKKGGLRHHSRILLLKGNPARRSGQTAQKRHSGLTFLIPVRPYRSGLMTSCSTLTEKIAEASASFQFCRTRSLTTEMFWNEVSGKRTMN